MEGRVFPLASSNTKCHRKQEPGKSQLPEIFKSFLKLFIFIVVTFFRLAFLFIFEGFLQLLLVRKRMLRLRVSIRTDYIQSSCKLEHACCSHMDNHLRNIGDKKKNPVSWIAVLLSGTSDSAL